MKDKGSQPELTRAYEIGFTNLATYCTEQFKENGPEQAQRNIETYIDKFYAKGIYAFILPEDKDKIAYLAKKIKNPCKNEDMD